MIGKKTLALLQTGLILLLAGCGASFDGKTDSDPAYIDRLLNILGEMDFEEQTLLGLTLEQWETATGLSLDIESRFYISENESFDNTVMIRTELINDELTTAIIGGLYLDAIEEANPEMPINSLAYDFGTEDKTILAGDFGQLVSGATLTESEDSFLDYLFDFQAALDEARASEMGFMEPDEFMAYRTMFEVFTYQLDIDLQMEINDSDYIQEQIQQAIIELINRGLTKGS